MLNRSSNRSNRMHSLLGIFPPFSVAVLVGLVSLATVLVGRVNLADAQEVAQEKPQKKATQASKQAKKKRKRKPARLPTGVKVVSGIVYSRGEHPQKLDLYLPTNPKRKLPVVVFVHGGGWKNGSRGSGRGRAAWLAEHQFAVVSIDYRLTSVAQWPAQIDDCYESVRWVRRNATKYGFDPDHIGAWGTSAGGHLVALMGTRKYPGDEKISSQVQAVCDWFGPTDLLTMPPNNVGNGRTAADVAKSNGAKLLGKTVREIPAKAKDASAFFQISSDDAPFLIMHGEKDPGVPLEQSKKFHRALKAAGVSSELGIVEGAGHGGAKFATPAVKKRVLEFFQRTLGGGK